MFTKNLQFTENLLKCYSLFTFSGASARLRKLTENLQFVHNCLLTEKLQFVNSLFTILGCGTFTKNLQFGHKKFTICSQMPQTHRSRKNARDRCDELAGVLRDIHLVVFWRDYTAIPQKLPGGIFGILNFLMLKCGILTQTQSPKASFIPKNDHHQSLI